MHRNRPDLEASDPKTKNPADLMIRRALQSSR